MIVTDTCAFLPCDQVDRCALREDGQCVKAMFQLWAPAKEPALLRTKALNGTKPKRGKATS